MLVRLWCICTSMFDRVLYTLVNEWFLVTVPGKGLTLTADVTWIDVQRPTFNIGEISCSHDVSFLHDPTILNPSYFSCETHTTNQTYYTYIAWRHTNTCFTSEAIHPRSLITYKTLRRPADFVLRNYFPFSHRKRSWCIFKVCVLVLCRQQIQWFTPHLLNKDKRN